MSSEVAFEIDQEQRKIIHECYEKTQEIINSNRDLLDLIANTLLEYETITKEQIEYLVENGHMPEEEKEDTNLDESDDNDSINNEVSNNEVVEENDLENEKEDSSKEENEQKEN